MKVYIAEENYDGGGPFETTILSIHLSRDSAETVAHKAFQKEYDDHQATKLKHGKDYKYEPEIVFYGQGVGRVGQISFTVSEYEVLP